MAYETIKNLIQGVNVLCCLAIGDFFRAKT